MGEGKREKPRYDFANAGFKTLAASPALQAIQAEMRSARERKAQAKLDALLAIKASHAQPALDLRATRKLPAVKTSKEFDPMTDKPEIREPAIVKPRGKKVLVEA